MFTLLYFFLLLHCIIFWAHALTKLPPTSNFWYLLDQKLWTIISRWPNHCNPLFCKHSFIVFNLSLFLSSAAEILFSGFPPLVWSNILLKPGHYAQVESNLLFVPNGKSLLVNRVNKLLNLLYPFLIVAETLPAALPLASIVSPRQQDVSVTSRNWSFIVMPVCYCVLLCLFPDLYNA